MIKKQLLNISLLSAAGACVLTGNAFGAVTVHSRISVDGTGMLAAAAMTGTVKETIEGNRARTETQVKFKSGLLQTVARSATGPQIDIVRLDEDKIYQLDPRKKRYREHSLAEIRAQLSQLESQSASMPVSFDSSRCDWSAARSKLTRESRGAIAGLDAQQWALRATQTCTDRESHGQCEVTLDSRLWTVPNSAISEEQRQFQQRYLQKLGLTSGMSRAPEERARALLSRYGDLWRASLEKMRTIDGHLLKSEFALSVNGPSCATSGQAAAADSQSDRATADTARDVAVSGTSAAVTEKTGNWRLGNLGGELVGKLLAKKNKPAQAGSSESSNNTTSSTLVRLSYEIVAIDNAAVAGDTFEIPGNYKHAK